MIEEVLDCDIERLQAHRGVRAEDRCQPRRELGAGGFSRTTRRSMDGTAYYPPLGEHSFSVDHRSSDASATVASG
jgi:hypothetical protein